MWAVAMFPVLPVVLPCACGGTVAYGFLAVVGAVRSLIGGGRLTNVLSS